VGQYLCGQCARAGARLPPEPSRLLNDLISPREQRGRHIEPKGLRGLQVDHQRVTGRRLHWEVSGLLASKDVVAAPKLMGHMRPVGYVFFGRGLRFALRFFSACNPRPSNLGILPRIAGSGRRLLPREMRPSPRQIWHSQKRCAPVTTQGRSWCETTGALRYQEVDEKGEVIEQALGQDRHAPRRRRLRCSPSYLIRWSVGDFLAMAVLMIAISILELLY
jgi:hypothetical protein